MQPIIQQLERRAKAFSLIELAACLVVLGLLTAVAALSLRSAKQNMDSDTWIERFTQLDQQLRQRAESQGVPWVMTIDLDAGTIQSQALDNSNDRSRSHYPSTAPSTTLGIPQGYTLRSVHTDQTDQHTIESGQAVIRYSTQGVSCSYGVELTHEQQPALRLLVVGATGQQIEISNEHAFENIFTALPTAGDDAG